MQFLHAQPHLYRLRELITSVPVFGERPPEPVVIRCPRCLDQWFADLEPYEELSDLEELEWEAQAKLFKECPDHSHRFTVGECWKASRQALGTSAGAAGTSPRWPTTPPWPRSRPRPWT